MKNIFKLVIAIICCMTCSCNDRCNRLEPVLYAYVSFINESNHFVSVSIDEIADMYKIDSFKLSPGEKYESSFGSRGFIIDRAIVTFDNDVEIVHELNQDPIPEGFRNICKNDPSWWEFEEEGQCGEKAHYTFRFTDADYEFAASQQ